MQTNFPRERSESASESDDYRSKY